MKLKITNVLEFYDVPQVFICEDDDKNKYLCATYYYDKGQISCIGIYLNNIGGKIDLRNVFTNTNNVKFDITSMYVSIIATRRERPFEEHMLPKKGFIYNLF